MKLYLSGSMTGNPEFVTRFAEEARALRDIGHDVTNPAELDNCQTWRECMIRDIPLVLAADAVVLMPGRWTDSGGTLIEAVVVCAGIAGKPVLRREGGALVPCPEIPVPPDAYAREIAQVAGAAWLAIMQIMSGAWKSNKHFPGEWMGEPKESHMIKASRHALTDYMKRTSPESGPPHSLRLLFARGDLTEFLAKTPEALCKDPHAPWQDDNEDHGAQAVCRSAMGWANKINGRS